MNMHYAISYLVTYNFYFSVLDLNDPLIQEDCDSEDRRHQLQRFVKLMKIEQRVLKLDELNQEIGKEKALKM